MQLKHRFLPRAGAALPLGNSRGVGCASLSVAARAALRLLMPALLLLTMAFGQAASAHPAGGQPQSHQSHASQTLAHHAKADDNGCCGDISQDEANKACLAQCLASCGYCAPLPLSAALPVKADSHPSPRKYAVLRGAIAAPHPRPPSIP